MRPRPSASTSPSLVFTSSTFFAAEAAATVAVEPDAESLTEAPTEAIADHVEQIDEQPDDDVVYDQEADAPAISEERGFIESVLVPDEPVDTSDDLTAMVRAVRESMLESQATPTVADEPEPAASEAREDKQRRRNGKRASVPSWDEIMFGRGGDR